MNRSYFIQKKIYAIFSYCFLLLPKSIIRLGKFLFTKRTILFVTNQKIRSIQLGPVTQLALLLSFIWIGNVFSQSLRYDKAIKAKSREITDLKSKNGYFEDEFKGLTEKLKKINEYLISTDGNKHQASSPKKDFKQPNNIKSETLSNPEKRTLNEIKNANLVLNEIQNIARAKIKKIENAINTTGLNFKRSASNNNKSKPKEKVISLNDTKLDPHANQGGPLVPLIKKDPYEEYALGKRLEKDQFDGEFNRLIFLEKLAIAMPLARPMKDYYISSGFGRRTDPVTHKRATHQGLDFVGRKNAEILSPSEGIVTLAGRYSDYGNAIVIDHGFGITTRYGHLSSVKVKKGQFVKKNQVIATQGSSGRSTGDHLHYEVRYKKTPLNPGKFLKAGDTLFNDKEKAKYVNS